MEIDKTKMVMEKIEVDKTETAMEKIEEDTTERKRGRMPDDEVKGYIMSMAVNSERPPAAVVADTAEEDNIPFATTKCYLAEPMSVSEEWIEEQRQWFKEDAARDQRDLEEMYDAVEQTQAWVRHELCAKGYVEVDEADRDDDCAKRVAEREEFVRELWDDYRGCLAGLKFADPSDPRCAVSYH